ncbi:DUF7210 family protein [Aliamphritea hakodatensis]|uniref:DUF7210 family protein n=1 Tax=Aliamphritea hakodatensis TaxID=2895352 RepID=UPI0022FD4A96|nr:hypothetical protein [Aliamphritea hakodatensis]
MPRAKKTADESKGVLLCLQKEHEHKGRQCKAGEEIEVSVHQSEWLVENGVAKKVVESE